MKTFAHVHVSFDRFLVLFDRFFFVQRENVDKYWTEKMVPGTPAGNWSTAGGVKVVLSVPSSWMSL